MPRLAAPLLAALLTLAATPVLAQSTISTDRPGFAFSPVVVPAGAFQVEVGTPQLTRISFQTAGGDATTTLLNAPTTLRYGITPRLEARVFSTLYNDLSFDVDGIGVIPGDVNGFGDVEVGVKYQLLTAGPGGTPNLSLIPTVVIPIGGDAFTAGDPVVNANVAAGFTLPSAFGLTLIAGATIPTADNANTTANLVALLGRSFTPQLSGYVEAAAFPSDEFTPLYAGAGLAYLVSNRVQLDAFFDAGLNDEAVDLIAGVGISARFGR